jgi:hypothetical protein
VAPIHFCTIIASHSEFREKCLSGQSVKGGNVSAFFPVAVDSGRQIGWIRHPSEVASAWKFGGAPPHDRGSRSCDLAYRFEF